MTWGVATRSVVREHFIRFAIDLPSFPWEVAHASLGWRTSLRGRVHRPPWAEPGPLFWGQIFVKLFADFEGGSRSKKGPGN